MEANGTDPRLGPDVAGKLDGADRVSEDIRGSIDAFIERSGFAAPTEASYRPVWRPGEDVLRRDARAAGIGAIVWAIGLAMDFGRVEAA